MKNKYIIMLEFNTCSNESKESFHAKQTRMLQ